MAVCTSCQHEFDAAEAFAGLCPYCGGRISPASRPADYVPPRLAKTFENNTAYYLERRIRRRAKWPLFWGVGVLLLLAALFFISWGAVNWWALQTDLQATEPNYLLPLPVAAADWLPADAKQHYAAGLQVLMTNQAAAEAEFQQSVAVYAPNIQARHQLGFMYLNANRLPEALVLYLEIVRLDRTDVQALINIGLIYERQGQPERAEEYLKRALEIRPDPEIEQRLQTIQAKLRS